MNTFRVPPLRSDDSPLIAHLVATTGLPESEVVRIVGDVLAFHAETRGGRWSVAGTPSCKTYGAKNDQIFPLLAAELPARVVAAPALTERQLRRIVYG